jgi:hypothetical protein
MTAIVFAFHWRIGRPDAAGESSESLPIRSKLRFHNLHHVSDPRPPDIHSGDRQGSRTHIHHRGQEDPTSLPGPIGAIVLTVTYPVSSALPSDDPSCVRQVVDIPARTAREASQKTLKLIT